MPDCVSPTTPYPVLLENPKTPMPSASAYPAIARGAVALGYPVTLLKEVAEVCEENLSRESSPDALPIMDCPSTRRPFVGAAFVGAYVAPMVVFEATDRALEGVGVPTPIRPALVILVLSKLFVLNTKATASVVPAKFVVATVPEFPVVDQSELVPVANRIQREPSQ